MSDFFIPNNKKQSLHLGIFISIPGVSTTLLICGVAWNSFGLTPPPVENSEVSFGISGELQVHNVPCVRAGTPEVQTRAWKDKVSAGDWRRPLTPHYCVQTCDVGMWSNLIFLPRVDKDRSGVISDSELQQALSNGKYLGPFLFLPPVYTPYLSLPFVFYCFIFFPPFYFTVNGLLHLLISFFVLFTHTSYSLILEMVRDFIFILLQPEDELKYTKKKHSKVIFIPGQQM